MQIRVEDLNYKNLKKINFDIECEKITGIVGNNFDDLNDLTDIICNNKKEFGKIKYQGRYSKKKIGSISIKDTYNMLCGSVYDFIVSKAKEYKHSIDKIDDIVKYMGFSKNILSREVSTLSTSEKIKVLFCQILLYNPDTIFVNNVLKQLDSKNRNTIFKLLINLNKFEHKTIVISTIDVDIIYEFVNNIIIVNNGCALSSSDKYSSYQNEYILDNDFIKKPSIINISNMVYKKSNINLGKNDSINELIKAIYREVR